MPYKYIRALAHLPTLASYLAREKRATRDDVASLRAAVAWLLAAQDKAGATGYAHSYHFAYGWQKPYPETTGYIIPTLLKAENYADAGQAINSVRKALQWLASIQADDGSYPDLSGRPQVFDVGQILIGLNYVHEHRPDLMKVEAPIRRAAKWLCDVQEADGSFIRHAYNDRPHSYYSRVGAALIKSGQLLDDALYIDTGIKNIEWTLSQQIPSGFFNHLSFDDDAPYLHNMIYVIEGLLEAARLMEDERYYLSAAKFSQAIKAATPAGEVPRSQYTPDFKAVRDEYCVTGLAQWAGVCFELAERKPEYAQAGHDALDFVARQQIFTANANIHGALTGSIPFSGKYLRYACPNWGVKFFIDALLARKDARI